MTLQKQLEGNVVQLYWYSVVGRIVSASTSSLYIPAITTSSSSSDLEFLEPDFHILLRSTLCCFQRELSCLNTYGWMYSPDSSVFDLPFQPDSARIHETRDGDNPTPVTDDYDHFQGHVSDASPRSKLSFLVISGGSGGNSI